MNFKTLNSNTTMRNIEEDILKYWEEEQIFKKISERHGNSGNFIFLEGPPTANGKPHVGHALTRTIKDTPLRYKTMRGYNIGRRSGGWDCHGLPVELEAEKHFGFKTKDEIVKFGIEKFNRYCKESVFRYIDEWNEMDRRIGFWVDGRRLIINRKISDEEFNNKLEQYLNVYVRCYECNSPDTEIVKEGRVSVIRCKACGAQHPISPSRELTINRDQVEEGKRYTVTIMEIGKSGEGRTKLYGYTIIVPGVKKGQTVQVEVKKIREGSAIAHVVK